MRPFVCLPLFELICTPHLDIHFLLFELLYCSQLEAALTLINHTVVGRYIYLSVCGGHALLSICVNVSGCVYTYIKCGCTVCLMCRLLRRAACPPPPPLPIQYSCLQWPFIALFKCIIMIKECFFFPVWLLHAFMHF